MDDSPVNSVPTQLTQGALLSPESDDSRQQEEKEKEQQQQQQQPEPDERPLYSIFSPRARKSIIAMTAFATLFSPLSSFMYLPAITPIAQSYGRSVSEINLTVTTYQIMQALAPLLFGDLSDQVGRRPVYVITLMLYLAADVGLALQQSYAALLALRALQSAGATATVAIASAVVADLTTSAERGAYMSTVQASVLFAPALAPVLGGLLTQFLGWRSTFWFLAAAAAVFLLIYLPFVPETARRVVGDGSVPPPPLSASLTTAHWRQRRTTTEDRGQARPEHEPWPRQGRWRRLRLPVPDVAAAVRIVLEKDVGPLMLFMSVLVMANFSVLIPLQSVIREEYSFDDVQVGLCYVPFAGGSVAGAVVVGRLLNWNYARVAAMVGLSPDRRRGDDLRRFPLERARLDLIWPFLAVAVAATAAWGWVVTSGTGLAAPLVVTFFAGLGIAGPVAVVTTLLVDLYPMNPGRVSSSFNLTRASISAVGSAAIQYIIDAWGYGFTYVFMALLIVAASPCVLIVHKWGPRWREERYQRLDKSAA